MQSKSLVFQLIPFLFLISLISACGSSKSSVTHDYDKDAPVEKYFTYQLVRPTGSELTHLPGIMDRDLNLIDKLIKDEMEKSKFTESENPDLLVGYHILSKKTAMATNTGSRVRAGAGSSFWGMGYTSGTYSVDYVEYIEGTLIVEMVDRENKKIVWHGASKQTVKEESSNKDIDSALKSAIKGIFWYFNWKPGGAKK